MSVAPVVLRYLTSKKIVKPEAFGKTASKLKEYLVKNQDLIEPLVDLFNTLEKSDKLVTESEELLTLLSTIKETIDDSLFSHSIKNIKLLINGGIPISQIDKIYTRLIDGGHTTDEESFVSTLSEIEEIKPLTLNAVNKKLTEIQGGEEEEEEVEVVDEEDEEEVIDEEEEADEEEEEEEEEEEDEGEDEEVEVEKTFDLFRLELEGKTLKYVDSDKVFRFDIKNKKLSLKEFNTGLVVLDYDKEYYPASLRVTGLNVDKLEKILDSCLKKLKVKTSSTFSVNLNLNGRVVYIKIK